MDDRPKGGKLNEKTRKEKWKEDENHKIANLIHAKVRKMDSIRKEGEIDAKKQQQQPVLRNVKRRWEPNIIHA